MLGRSDLKGLRVVVAALFVAQAAWGAGRPTAAQEPAGAGAEFPTRDTRAVAGWTVHVDRRLVTDLPRETEEALRLLAAQLEEITRVVPAGAVAELRGVPLWLTAEYPGIAPKAEYHPDPGWLRRHGRDPAMARAVEFTNVRIFAAETRRMPNVALHELAHAFHHRVLADGFDNAPLRRAHERAEAAGLYDRVEQRDAAGQGTIARAYALTNPQEFFAECSEAFFARNDFFPFDRPQLRAHDPETCELLATLWGCDGDQ